jgi:hypothetical protein
LEGLLPSLGFSFLWLFIDVFACVGQFLAGVKIVLHSAGISNGFGFNKIVMHSMLVPTTIDVNTEIKHKT